MRGASDNLDLNGQATAGQALSIRRRPVLATTLAFALAAGLMSLGISTGRTALSSAAGVSGDPDRPIAGTGSAGRPASLFTRWLGRGGARSSISDRDRVRADLLGPRAYIGRPIRAAYTLRMRVTAYSPDERSCGDSADGITASGYSVFTNGGFLVAADPKVLPLGSLLSVPGYDDGSVVPILDVGGAIKGNRLDVLFPTHEIAMEWGIRDLDVTVWEYADGLPNGFKRLRRPSK